jgi:hypothetical protein
MAAEDPSRWSRLHGVNFFTSNASNATSMWQRFDPEQADRELGWMEQLGFNSVRLWLSEKAWREQPAVFRGRLKMCLDLCVKHKLSAMLVLFDSCGIEPRADAVETAAGDAYRRFLESPQLTDAQKQILRARYAGFAEGRGRLMPVPVGKDTPFDIIFWQHWTPNPGLSRIGSENWRELDAYMDAVMQVAARHPATTAIDLMNEPATLMDLPAGLTYSEARKRVDAFIGHTAAHLKSGYPSVEQTIGSSNLEDLKSLARHQTVLSVHSYELEGVLVKTLQAASDFARGVHKGLILSECLANTDNWLKNYGEESISTDEGQLRHYQHTLPIILNSGMGWYGWGGIGGKMFTPATDLIYPGGYLRPAALYLQEELRRTHPPEHP